MLHTPIGHAFRLHGIVSTHLVSLSSLSSLSLVLLLLLFLVNIELASLLLLLLSEVSPLPLHVWTLVRIPSPQVTEHGPKVPRYLSLASSFSNTKSVNLLRLFNVDFQRDGRSALGKER